MFDGHVLLLAVISAMFLAWPSIFGVWRRIVTKASARLRNQLNSWLYLFFGPSMIQEAYDTAQQAPFEIHGPDNRYVFVSSPDNLKELNSAPDTVLSLQAASKQMLQPNYTMSGFNWFDRRGTEGVGFIRALRTLLTNDVPNILPQLRINICHQFDEMLASQKFTNSPKHSPVYQIVLSLTVKTNALAFFGESLASNEKFVSSALEFIEHTLKTAEIVRLLPKAISPIVGRILGSRLTSHKVVYSTLLSAVEQRLMEDSLAKHGHEASKHHDCIQWIMETVPKKQPWSARRIVHELMAIWFGSVHAVSTTTTFAIHDLCLHPEYQEPLFREVSGFPYETFERTAQGLPFLDSFIKESARLTPVEAMSSRRQALQPFTLSSGHRVDVGDWLCTPVSALMQDSKYYPNPLEFNGFRFVDPKLFEATGICDIPPPIQNRPSKLTDTSSNFHVWGTGRMVCPGRFYATAIMKMMLAQIILKYHCQLIDRGARRTFTWRSTTLPRPSLMVSFQPR